MDEVCKGILEKISSYNIFNNFFPGIIFCYLVKQTTRFSFDKGEFWEKIFIYYFIGMIISRLSSILVEKVLQKLTVINKGTRQKEPFINFVPYSQYSEASEERPFIKILNETNNCYRTFVAVAFTTILVKLYDLLLYDWIINIGKYANSILEIIILVIILIVFVGSYRKQTNYIRKRVEEYFLDKNGEDK